jgi:Zn-dependent protease with chaperone function
MTLDLETFYFEKVWEHRNKYHRTLMRWLVAIAVIVVLILLNLVTGEDTSPRLAIEAFLLLGSIPVALTALIARRSQLKFMKRRTVRSPTPTQLAVLTSAVSRVSRPLGVDPGVFFHIDITRVDTSPAVARYKGKSHLLIPLGFIGLLRHNETVALAMLAHEMSHVLQEDTQLGSLIVAWPRAYIITILVMPFVPAFLSGGLTGIPQFDGTTVAVIWSLGTVACLMSLPFFLLSWVRLVAIRRRAEHVADIGAMVAVGPDAVRTALATLQHEPWWCSWDPFRPYPTPDERRSFLANVTSALHVEPATTKNATHSVQSWP